MIEAQAPRRCWVETRASNKAGLGSCGQAPRIRTGLHLETYQCPPILSHNNNTWKQHRSQLFWFQFFYKEMNANAIKYKA